MRGRRSAQKPGHGVQNQQRMQSSQRTGCCEGCNGGDPVAVRNDGSFEKLVCSPSSVCAGCLPEPSSAVPYCGQDGHCQAVFREDAGG
jgi:hypothetical protein